MRSMSLMTHIIYLHEEYIMTRKIYLLWSIYSYKANLLLLSLLVYYLFTT